MGRVEHYLEAIDESDQAGERTAEGRALLSVLASAGAVAGLVGL